MQLLSIGRDAKRNVSALAFAPDGSALVASAIRANPALWTLPAVGEPVRLTSVAQRPAAFAFTFSDGSNLVGWMSSQTRYECDRAAGTVATPVALVQDPERLVTQATYGPDNRLVIRTAESGVGHRIRCYTRAAGAWKEEWTVGPSNELNGWRIIAGADRADRFFTWEITPVTGPRMNRIAARSSLTGEILAITTISLYYLVAMVAAPDGSMVVCFKDSSLYAWRPGEEIQKVRTGTLKYYRALAFHPDCRHLLAGNNDTTARLIDTHTWQIVRQYAWDIGRLSAVAVSPDGTLAAAGGTRGRVVVWDLDL